MKRFRLLTFLFVAAAQALVPVGLRAQEPGTASHQPSPGTSQAEEHGPAPDRRATEQGAAVHEAGAIQEGAAESEGAHHPVIKLGPYVLNEKWQFAMKVINFLIFAGGLFFLTRGALSAAFKARAKELGDRLSQAETDKAEGEAQIAALEAKMAGLQEELSGILRKAEVDSEAEKQRILDGARLEAAAILAQTRTDIDNQRKAAEAELRALVAGLAAEGAAKKLKAELQGAAAATTMDRAIEQISHAGGLQ